MKQLSRTDEPSVSLLDHLFRRLRTLGGLAEEEGGLKRTLEELLEEQGEAASQLTALERSLLLNALSFGDLRVDDVMIPRTDICAVELDSSLAEVVSSMREAGHSRLLVYRETLDDVVGLVHIKDLLPFWGDGEHFQLREVMRPVLIIPPSMRVIDLLRKMQAQHAHMATVVDEFGGTDGLLTIEDLIEEIVGELNDEHDQLVEPQLVDRKNGVIEADARVALEDLEERLDVQLIDEPDRDDVDTVGGLVFSLMDRVPVRGESVVHPAGYVFEVLDADPRRIKRLRISRTPHGAPTGNGAPS